MFSSGPGVYFVSVILHRNKQAISALQTTGDTLQKIFEMVERERKKLGKDVVALYQQITYQKPGGKKMELDVHAYNQEGLQKLK